MTDGTSNKVVALQAPRVPRGSQVQPQNASRWYRERMTNLTPARVTRILRDAERGDMESWGDLVEYMLRTDPHVRAVYDTWVKGVVGAELRVEAGRGNEGVAEDVAEFVRTSLEGTPRLPALLAHLMHGEGAGISALEHDWRREGRAWHSRPTRRDLVMVRDIDYADDWTPRVRTYRTDVGQPSVNGRWLRTDLEPARWVVHEASGIGTTPNLGGVLQAVVWPWLFKRWAIIFRQSGLERLANGLLIGRVTPSSHDEAREALFDALEQLRGDHIGIIEQDTEIEFIEPTGTVGDAWSEAIGEWNAEITKGILGSTLNTEIGAAGGNRAAAESQARMTMLPRLQAAAQSLAATIEEQWVAPLVRFNAARWPGAVPPMPRVRLVLEAEAPPEVDDLLVSVGAVTVDEMRASRGLPELGPDAGGDRIAVPVAKSRPEFSAPRQEGGAPAPFGRSRGGHQMPLPWTTTRRSSPTCSDSTTRVDSVPVD